MTRAPSLTWIHVGDLHMDEANGWQSGDRLATIVAELNRDVGDAADFVYLPGDHADQATEEQYRVIVEVAADGDRDAIDVLVRGAGDIPRRTMPVALGRDVHAIGRWAEHGIEGTRLGPNSNGKHW